MHPFDSIFGTLQSKIAQNSTKYSIKITKQDFLDINWPYAFPLIVNDVIEYLTGFCIKDCLRKQQEEKRMEKLQKEF